LIDIEHITDEYIEHITDEYIEHITDEYIEHITDEYIEQSKPKEGIKPFVYILDI